MPSSPPINVTTKQNKTTHSEAELSKSSTNKTASPVIPSNSINMGSNGEKVPTDEELAAMGAEIAKTLVAANQMSTSEVKRYKAKIYNLFSGVPQPAVDMGVAAYFMVNDPSPSTNWGSAPPVTVGGKSVPATDIVGGIISVSDGDGALRKFLSTAYEADIGKVIKFVPGVDVTLQARAAKHGMVGVNPLTAVSWVKGVTPGTSSSGAARSVFRTRAVNTPRGIADQVVPMDTPEVVSKGGVHNQEYY
jgi:hypothetical protein